MGKTKDKSKKIKCVECTPSPVPCVRSSPSLPGEGDRGGEADRYTPLPKSLPRGGRDFKSLLIPLRGWDLRIIRFSKYEVIIIRSLYQADIPPLSRERGTEDQRG